MNYAALNKQLDEVEKRLYPVAAKPTEQAATQEPAPVLTPAQQARQTLEALTAKHTTVGSDGKAVVNQSALREDVLNLAQQELEAERAKYRCNPNPL